MSLRGYYHISVFVFLSAFLLFNSFLGCSLFENCKTCSNGTWKANDDFFINGKYCTECRQGWSGGDCKSELHWWITHDCCQGCLTKTAQLHLYPITEMESMAQTTNLPAVPHFSLSCSHKHLVLPVVILDYTESTVWLCTIWRHAWIIHISYL